jgi:hypothetical protein
MPGSIRFVQRDYEHGGDRSLRTRDRRCAGGGREQQGEARCDDDLERSAADECHGECADADPERDTGEKTQGLLAARARLSAERDECSDWREEGLGVARDLTCQLPCDPGCEGGLRHPAEDSAVEAAPDPLGEVAQRLHRSIFYLWPKWCADGSEPCTSAPSVSSRASRPSPTSSRTRTLRLRSTCS